MRKYFPHAFVAATLHIVALLVAHKVAVEVLGLVRDELFVTYAERAYELVLR